MHVAVSHLQKWNTWISLSCSKGLYAAMSSNNTRAVCISASGAALATISMSTGSKASATARGPTQAGIVTGYTKFHIVEDPDTWASILTAYNSTIPQFYAWNPSNKISVGSNCENVWSGYALCVAGGPS
ncbi:uncharacterized protein BDR25DRAFT_288613 [Lindgomyces ingoldianus]|uniref:Uncharacterized protein n=1 Tax=Lindgomyces ingoldianus TaxID=673940 RepID=A0ACB6QRM0_9PLEO|nr:uncharacterized protein BDR25DRAFT_288613 [Lindgomyces ingoldianus]KAF2469669.1 hypothetical protein BDR25DRAFT_288613 [Lindgomyces ingoldianus]